MSDPQDRLGFLLSGVPWFGALKAEGGLVTQEREARWKAAKIIASPRCQPRPNVTCDPIPAGNR